MAEETLTLRTEHLEAMVRHAEQDWPHEACGLLGGPPGQVAQVYPVANAYHSPVEYYMDPEGQIRAMLAIEAAGWELSGIYHSHPAGPATPSPTDVERAFYPDSVYIIISRTLGQWSARGFRIMGGAVREVRLAVLPENGQ